MNHPLAASDAVVVCIDGVEAAPQNWGLEGLYLRWASNDQNGQELVPSGNSGLTDPGYEAPSVSEPMHSELKIGRCLAGERRSRRWGMASQYGKRPRLMRLGSERAELWEVEDETGAPTAKAEIPLGMLLPVSAEVRSADVPRLLATITRHTPLASAEEVERQVQAAPHAMEQTANRSLHVV